MNTHSATGIPLFDVDDDALFPTPVAFLTWDGCVETWNRCLEYQNERCQYLLSVLERAADSGRLSPTDRGFLELSLDALAGKLALALEIQNRAFDTACRVRYGFGVGDVIEADSADGLRLCEISGGGLPIDGHKPNIRFTVNMVEPFQDGWLSARVGFPVIDGTPESLAQNIRKRPDVKLTKPTDSPVHWLPLELLDHDIISVIRNRINPKGLSINRNSVLLAFWEKTLFLQQQNQTPYNDGDIIAIKKPSTPLFHVVFQGDSSKDKGCIMCYDPRGSQYKGGERLFGELTRLSITRGTKLSCALPASSYYGSTQHLPHELSMAFAIRETARSLRHDN